MGWLRSAVRVGAGVSIGAVTAVVDLAYVAGVAVVLFPVLPWQRSRQAMRRRAEAGARRLATVERWRVAVLMGGEQPAAFSGRRALAYLAVRWTVGMLGGAVLLLLVWGAVSAAVTAWLWLGGERADGIAPTPVYVTAFLVTGTVFLFLALAGIAGVAELERRLARQMLGPSARELYERRIEQLSASRAEVVRAVNDERRRIERDLHDGVQQRLVALGMLLGRARRSQDAERAARLIQQAQQEAQQALDDLREVAWRVFPSALDSGGLVPALETVAERSPIPVRLHCELPERPAGDAETVAYFVVCEAVTNAVKHSKASTVTIHIGQRDGTMVARIHDDGVGGADRQGGGLSGLARRVAALDGRLDVDSPSGGPTIITMELPCA